MHVAVTYEAETGKFEHRSMLRKSCDCLEFCRTIMWWQRLNDFDNCDIGRGSSRFKLLRIITRMQYNIRDGYNSGRYSRHDHRIIRFWLHAVGSSKQQVPRNNSASTA